MPINVLYMIDSLAYGGAELQLVELIRRLDRNNFCPHLCTFNSSENLYDELDIPKIVLGNPRFGHYSLFGKLWRLRRFVIENKIQIIQTYFQDPFLLAALIKPFTRVDLVGTFLDLGFWRTPAENWKMRFAYQFFSGFIANSMSVKDHFVTTDGISKEKIEVIYNGFDSSVIPMEKIPSSHPKDSLVVGIVANLNRPVKRVQDFIRAAALVKGKIPQTRFVVVGDGHLRGDLETLADSLGLAGSIYFTGRVSDPLNVVQTFDVGVLASETEGFSNAIIEYMACGLPVVVTDVGGNPELVAEGENGYLVPVGQCELLAERIIGLLADDSGRIQIGVRNREKIRQEFGWSIALERQCKYYEQLAGR